MASSGRSPCVTDDCSALEKRSSTLAAGHTQQRPAGIHLDRPAGGNDGRAPCFLDDRRPFEPVARRQPGAIQNGRIVPAAEPRLAVLDNRVPRRFRGEVQLGLVHDAGRDEPYEP